MTKANAEWRPRLPVNDATARAGRRLCFFSFSGRMRGGGPWTSVCPSTSSRSSLPTHLPRLDPTVPPRRSPRTARQCSAQFCIRCPVRLLLASLAPVTCQLTLVAPPSFLLALRFGEGCSSRPAHSAAAAPPIALRAARESVGCPARHQPREGQQPQRWIRSQQARSQSTKADSESREGSKK